MKNRANSWVGCLVLLLLGGEARAELRSLEIVRREPFAGGMAFGSVGPYEKLVGIARFAVDPGHPRNRAIIDLPLAPRNGNGKVEFACDVFILAPKNPARGNRAIFYDVNNRGNKLALRFFNFAPGGNDPTSAADAGDGFLMRRGYTIVWCGWIGELLPGNFRLLLQPPVATDKGKPIAGIVRYEMLANQPAEVMPLAGRGGHGNYPPTKKGEAEGVLTWRMRPYDERVPIPRAQWSLERTAPKSVAGSIGGTLPEVRLRLTGGFRPGYLYEWIGEVEGPIVQGLGFAAVRDLISFLRHDSTDRNPLRADGKPAIARAYGFGVSQSGRFLRNFLYLGFNADEGNRPVFDGVMSHVAGGGLGFFNHRFAQPTRNAGQHDGHFYPTDYFPFTYGDSSDPFTQRTDGILRRTRTDHPKLLPKVMHTQSAAEYWHRSGSLVHTTPLGSGDAEVPKEVRIYAFGGTQHGPASDPPGRGSADNLLNPADYRPFLRGLLDALDAWARDGTEPPASVYPRIDQGTLVAPDRKSTRFPALAGVSYPTVIQRPPLLDFGPEFTGKGRIAHEPPKVRGHYMVLVPRCGADGNEQGTLLPPEVAVPLATYTGWNLRNRQAGAEEMLVHLAGSYLPLPRTREERQKNGDPRESVEERYGGFETYRKQFAAGCDDLVKRRYLLREDADRLTKSREKLQGLFPAAGK